MPARMADARPIRVMVVGGQSVFTIFHRVPGEGVPVGGALFPVFTEINPCLVAIDCVGECGDQNAKISCLLAFWWADEKGDGLPIVAAGKAGGIGAAAQAFRNGEAEIGLPAAIRNIVRMEVNRSIGFRRMGPIALLACPVRASHGTSGRIDQCPMQPVRSGIADSKRRHILGKVPCREWSCTGKFTPC